MNSIDPKTGLFQLSNSSSTTGLGEKTSTGNSGSASQENSHEFEGFLEKISQPQRIKEDDGKFAIAANQFLPEMGLNNTLLSHENISNQDGSPLPNLSLKTMTVERSPFAINDSKMTSKSQNNVANFQKGSTEYVWRPDSKSKDTMTSPLTDMLISSLTALSMNLNSSQATPITHVSNDPLAPISNKSSEQLPQADSDLSNHNLEEVLPIFSPSTSNTFQVQGKKIELTVLDQQNHFAPVWRLTQSQPFDNHFITQNKSGNSRQVEISSSKNIGSGASSLEPSSAKISDISNLNGLAGDSAPKAIQTQQLMDVDIPSIVAFAKSQHSVPTTNSVSLHVTSPLQTYNFAPQTYSVQGPKAKNPTIYPKLSSDSLQPLQTEQNVSENKSISIKSNQIQEVNFNNSLTYVFSDNPLQNSINPPHGPRIGAGTNISTQNLPTKEALQLPSYISVAPAMESISTSETLTQKPKIVTDPFDATTGFTPDQRSSFDRFSPTQSKNPNKITSTELTLSSKPIQNTAKYLSGVDTQQVSQLQKLGSFNDLTVTPSISSNKPPVSEPVQMNLTSPINVSDESVIPSVRLPNHKISSSFHERESLISSENTENISNSTSNKSFLSDARLNEVSTNSSTSISPNMLNLDMVLSSSIVPGRVKTGDPELLKPSTRIQLEDIEVSGTGVTNPLRAISGTELNSSPNVAYKSRFVSDDKLKNNNDLILQNALSAPTPDADLSPEKPNKNNFFNNQINAISFHDMMKSSSAKSEYPLDIGTSRMGSVLPTNMGNLASGFSPIEQITMLIAQKKANPSTPSYLSNSNVGQSEGIALTSGLKTMSLALEPQDLGSVVIKLRLSSNGLDMHVEADKPGTAQLIENDKDKLLSGLQQSGYLVDTLVVKATDNQSAVLQHRAYGEDNKPSAESIQRESQAIGLGLHQENSNANDSSGSESKNRQTKLVELEPTSGDLSPIAGNGDIYI